VTLLSVSPDIPSAQYSLYLFLAAALSIILFVGLLIKVKYTLIKSMIWTLVLFVFLYYLAYLKADEFYSIEVEGEHLVLSYIPPVKEKRVLIKDVRTVTFGLASKVGSLCFITLKMQNGDVYDSTVIFEKVSYCKNKRKALLALIDAKS